MAEKKLYKTGQAAKFIGVSKKTIHRWRYSKILIPDTLTEGGRCLYSHEQLVEFLHNFKNVDIEKNFSVTSVKNVDIEKNFSVTSVKNVDIESKNCPPAPYPPYAVIKNVDIEKKSSQNFPQIVTNSENVEVEVLNPEENKCKNIVVFPSRKRIEANDKLTEKVFSLLSETYYDMVTTGSKYDLVEIVNHKKYGEILTPFWLELINGYTDKTPLDQFDRAVLAACISEWLASNRYTTPSIIYRHLTGKNHSYDNPTLDQRNKILKSIDRLMCTQLKVDMTEVCGRFGYNHNGRPIKLTSTLLPSAYVEGITVNGQDGTVIFFDRESPILTIARAKKQLLTYDERLLDVSHQHNSFDMIAVKNYILQRIQEIKLHKLTAIIRFDDVFKKCRLNEAHNEQKRRTRKVIVELIEHLKAEAEIVSFEVHKEKNKFAYITFEY